MVPLMLLASVSVMMTHSASGPSSSGPVVRAVNNGEFIADHYPPGARKRGEQGKVSFQLTIEPDGSLGSCQVTKSSGFPALDSETCEFMMTYARFQPVRNAEGRAIRSVTSGFIDWKLPSGSTRMASVASSGKSLDPDKIICKRSQTTGSLIARTKQCMTRSEWARQEQIMRDEMDRLQGRGNVDCKSTGAC